MKYTVILAAVFLALGGYSYANSPSEEAERGPVVKDWTVMVYMNAKNDLDEAALKDMNEMEEVGSGARVNVVVQLGRSPGGGSPGNWSGVRRYMVVKDADTSRISSPVLQDLGNEDMGYHESLSRFGNWAKREFPAKHYALIVWSHGTGWVRTAPKASDKGISYDFEYGSNLTVPQLGRALRDMSGAEVYASDACLMQMAEVAYELKDSAQYIVGSQEDVPNDGYPYADLLRRVTAEAGAAPERIALLIAGAYADHYENEGTGSTHSVIRTSAMPAFAEAVNDWTRTVMTVYGKDIVRAARIGSEKYANADNRDLYHFTQILGSSGGNAVARAKGQVLMDIIRTRLVLLNRTTNSTGSWLTGTGDYSRSHGISIYLPSSEIMAGYSELRWAGVSGWSEFTKWYIEE